MPRRDEAMPASKRRKADRVPVRIPKPIINAVDDICSEYPEYAYNRQQFVETSIREKIEKIRLLEKKSSGQK